ncbi:sulfatase-like hydrolase/transferase [Pelagicoccus mobilis]|uniref:Sulfatase-like hydrolase/transferase n=1 Tax=Pelagicoccus mobilis TaxID=415221 RepID=A0A934S1Q8_9BACT|nr:sulfatase-like hydrolase/transferase [Pelagicoccus mobilis]MBK1877488.1 sulfatase-like hydrolase/transferase [Pelagicoccus mobilis]
MNMIRIKASWRRCVQTFAALNTAALLAATSHAKESKPNILFIFTDDQSHETIAHLGNDEIITPNLDRLAQNGVYFSNTYNMGAWNGAVCIASRTCLNTGLGIWQAGEAEPTLGERAQRGEFWSQLMSQAGYETYISGKWHVKTKVQDLFDHSANIRGGMPKDTPEGYYRPKENDTWTPWDKSFGGFWQGGEHWSEVLATDAEGFLENAGKSDKPFFMYLAFNSPHDPRQAPKEYVDMYPREKMRVPANFLTDYPYKQEIGNYEVPDNNEGILRDERLGGWPRTHELARLHKQEYYACITHTDAQIGRILDALEKTGKADNTYIIFTSDHGLAYGHHGLLGKQNMYEHSMKPPLIITGPGVPKNETRDAFVYLQDVMPTTLELAGAKKPDYVFYNSLNPFIENENTPTNYPEVYGNYRADYQRMIRVGDHKLILYPLAGVYRLFDVSKDPQEMRDLAQLGGEYKDLAAKLFRKFRKLQKDVGDPLDLTEIFADLM